VLLQERAPGRAADPDRHDHWRTRARKRETARSQYPQGQDRGTRRGRRRGANDAGETDEDDGQRNDRCHRQEAKTTHRDIITPATA
jgi:hypothetical protein